MEYLEQFIELADGVKLNVIIGMIFANLLTGIAVSIYTKQFRLKAIGDFLLSRVVPYIIGYAAVVAVAVVEPTWEVAVNVVWGVILAALTGAILSNLSEMGIKLPDTLSGDKNDAEQK